ncbi:MAG: diguanylate cyclase (GGDEF)-like protein [Colwellia sp.]|jgi:diguanylate cyclase (GGDEF)-like protein
MINRFPYTNNVIDCVDSGVFVIDKNFTVHLWNDYMAIRCQFSSDDIVGLNLFDCFPELPQKWFERKIKSVFILNSPSYSAWEQRTYLFEFPHGRSVTGGVDFMYQNCCFTPIIGQDNNVEYACVTIKDVTDIAIATMKLKKTVTELERISSVDGLTQVYNRFHWEKCFKNEVDRVNRYKHPVSLIMLDMDFFKKINDVYGHLCGDEVLRQTAKRCTESLRSADVIGRYGGEEFCIFLPETNLASAAHIAEKLKNIIADTPVYYKSLAVSISASIGFTSSSTTINNHEKLINEADTALYVAKNNGRAQCVNFYDCDA